MEDGRRPFRVYHDASMDVLGATLKQGTARRLRDAHCHISRATLDSERYWTLLNLQAYGNNWAVEHLGGYLWDTKFRVCSDYKALENIGQVGDHNARVQKWREYLTAFHYTLEYRKGRANDNANFLSHLPRPATEHDRSGSSRLAPEDHEAMYLVRARSPNLHTGAPAR